MVILLEDYRPKPKQRPRFGRNRNVYSPSAEAERSLAWRIKAMVMGRGWPIPVRCPIDVYIFALTKKKLRGDSDNYKKFILDALQKSQVIENDSQVELCLFVPLLCDADRLLIRIKPAEGRIKEFFGKFQIVLDEFYEKDEF